MDEYNAGAAPSVARLLLELRGRATVDVRTVGRALQVRPQGATGVAVYIHPGGVDVAVDPEKANDVALSMPGAYVRDPDDPNTVVSVEADLIDANYDALLDAAVQAVDLRRTTPPAKAARSRSTAGSTSTPRTPRAKAEPRPRAAAKVPVERPRCPKCRQYELLASGECPSGYC
ncbi:hypothetical protein [Actinoplanes sp. DH11]|uniref:hypothetical protein n=1 Tax=Actinoplanes sp. DH11 TaxID=2857011 RepID=UPI001E2F1631|nr:hypothetical protein [Actinoplanes sp. DH11]